MIIFISGGCKNGKSIEAQRMAKKLACKNNSKLYYVATMIPKDEEDLKRVKRHLDERRGWGFETVEVDRSLTSLIDNLDTDGVYLFDSITALLENNLFDQMTFEIDKEGPNRVIHELLQFADEIKKGKGSIVFVSDFIYSDSIVYDESTEIYKKSLAKCDRAVANISYQVMEVVLGNIINYKKETI